MECTILFCVCLVLFKVTSETTRTAKTREDYSYWQQLAKDDIRMFLKPEVIEGTAKNVIIFVGDGMGPNTVTAARIYGKGEDGYLSFERFPHIGALKTYNSDKYVPDSCSTATALFSGVKTNQKLSGLDATVSYKDCTASLNPKTHLDSIFVWAQAAGKSTGFVTTTRVTHATPSALFAHTPDRNWECDAKIPPGSSECKDIARQLIEDDPGRNIQVIMGGGRQCLQSDANGTEEDPLDNWACYSKDGRDLIKQWKEDKENRAVKHSVLYNNEDLSNLDLDSDFVLGVFANSHMQMDYKRNDGPKGSPSLLNMTEKTIQILQKNPKGYILMVEGGLIDYAHHRGHARQALDETVAFSDAVAKTLEMIKEYDSESETLVIVTSDHSHSLVFTGYAQRGTGVLGIAEPSVIDSVNYTSLLYGTGGPNNYQFEALNNTIIRPNPENTDDFDYSQQAAVLTDEVTHSGTDVLIYAKGPYAHLFGSVHEQTYVAYVIGYAAKIGPFKSRAGCLRSNLIVIFTVLGFVLLFSL